MRFPDYTVDPEVAPILEDENGKPSDADALEAEAWRVTRRAYEYHGFGITAAARFGSILHPTITYRRVKGRIVGQGWTKTATLSAETPKTRGAAVARARRAELAAERAEESIQTLEDLRDRLFDAADAYRFHTKDLAVIAAAVVRVTAELRALGRDQFERERLAEADIDPNASTPSNAAPSPDERSKVQAVMRDLGLG